MTAFVRDQSNQHDRAEGFQVVIVPVRDLLDAVKFARTGRGQVNYRKLCRSGIGLRPDSVKSSALSLRHNVPKLKPKAMELKD